MNMFGVYLVNVCSPQTQGKGGSFDGGGCPECVSNWNTRLRVCSFVQNWEYTLLRFGKGL